jgi:nuclear pore complex protein Nup188
MFTALSSTRACAADTPSTWDIAYRALCDPETASKSDTLRVFLTASENTHILSRPWKPFADPSPQEKSKFESKTAPISVTPSANGHYNLDEIKEDSLWLSHEAQISEYAALQLVAQEWQSRPTVQLLSGLTEEEALSVQDAAGITNLGASTFAPNSSLLSTPLVAKVTQFDTQDQRRLRILEVYHSTCAAIIRISQLLVSWGVRLAIAKPDHLRKRLPHNWRRVDRRARPDDCCHSGCRKGA